MEGTRIRLQYFCFRGHNYITNKVSCLSCMGHAYWSSSSSLPNIIKLFQTVWELWPAQFFGFRGDNYISKKVRVVSLACDVPTGPPLHSYQILSKYVQGYRNYGAHKHASTDGWTDGRHADRYNGIAVYMTASTKFINSDDNMTTMSITLTSRSQAEVKVYQKTLDQYLPTKFHQIISINCLTLVPQTIIPLILENVTECFQSAISSPPCCPSTLAFRNLWILKSELPDAASSASALASPWVFLTWKKCQAGNRRL